MAYSVQPKSVYLLVADFSSTSKSTSLMRCQPYVNGGWYWYNLTSPLGTKPSACNDNHIHKQNNLVNCVCMYVYISLLEQRRPLTMLEKRPVCERRVELRQLHITLGLPQGLCAALNPHRGLHAASRT